jgi:hypothetical protein
MMKPQSYSDGLEDPDQVEEEYDEEEDEELICELSNTSKEGRKKSASYPKRTISQMKAPRTRRIHHSKSQGITRTMTTFTRHHLQKHLNSLQFDGQLD